MPARLKFLRSDRAEAQAIVDVVRRLALAEPFVGFRLTDASGDAARLLFRADAGSGDLCDALAGRLSGIVGRDFVANAVRIEAERDGIRLLGHAGLPTFSRGAAAQQYLFVNGRPVRDKLLFGALAGAYSDLLPRGPASPPLRSFVDCDPTTGRRQRPSRQGRGPLPRPGPRPRARRLGGPPRAGGRRPPRRDHGRRRRARARSAPAV